MGSNVSTTSIDATWVDRLAEEAGAKVEVDNQGSVIVSPATDAHAFADSELRRQLLARGSGPAPHSFA